MTDWVNFAGQRPSAKQFAMMAVLLACGLACSTQAQAQVGMAYVKAGPAFGLDNNFFESTNVGWTIAGGVRQPFAARGPGGFLFIDLGGSYLGVSGDADPRPTPGVFTVNGPLGPVSSTPLPDLLDAQLIQIDRGSVDTAIGWQRTPNGPGGGVGFMFRLGGRLGHVHGEFHEAPSATTEALIAGLAPNQTASLLENYSKTDTFGGLFCGAGVNFMNRDIRTAAFGPLGMALGAEFEYSHDWIDFGNYESNGFSTGAAMFSFELFR